MPSRCQALDGEKPAELVPVGVAFRLGRGGEPRAARFSDTREAPLPRARAHET
jgi:hypothetical protein